MQLSHFRYENQWVVRAEGRLDASWADFFQETLVEQIRSGEHRILLDAAGIVFLSSMGIRALMVLYKELKSVQGTFQIIHADGMVKDTLTHSGLGLWLSDLKIKAPPAETHATGKPVSEAFERFTLDGSASLDLSTVEAWQPWSPVDQEACEAVRFETDLFGLGIGGAGATYGDARAYQGEFMGVGGHVAVQTPDERGRPDCLLSENEFVPSLQCIQSLVCRGSMSHLLRFRSTDECPVHTVSSVIHEMLCACGADTIGFVMVGEVEGLVGANLIASPGTLTPDDSVAYPAIKSWLSFTGERVFAREQALMAGVAKRVGDGRGGSRALSPLGSRPDILAHCHAAVFPYQLLPNGRVALDAVVDRFFKGPPPRAVMHLIDDQRPGNGLGESALFNGAGWCAPIKNSEVLS